MITKKERENGISVGQFGTQLMKYWPAIVGAILIVSAAGVTNWRVNQNEKILDIIVRKLEANEIDKAQGRIIVSLLEDIKGLETRLDAVEVHITPDAIQAWGAIQSIVEEDHRDLKAHLWEHE